MVNQFNPSHHIPNIVVLNGNKVNFVEAKDAIARINQVVKWSHDNNQIFEILQEKPKYCFFAKKDNDLVGYAILRDEGDLKHLHVSWIATDRAGIGVGSHLMHKIIMKSKKQGHQFLTLHHRKANEQAKRFYENVAKFEGIQYSREERDPIRYRVTYEM